MKPTLVFTPHRGVLENGSSLIITLIMLVIIGLTAAASMRGAISSEKVVNNLRVEALAQQYAETALRFCESQLSLPSASRVSTLQDSQLTPTVAISAAQWQVSTTWTTTPSAVLTTINAAQFVDVNSTIQSANVPAPQCFVERVSLLGGSTSFVVTARGFSPDYTANSDGTTKSGAVVWLQSLIALN